MQASSARRRFQAAAHGGHDPQQPDGVAERVLDCSELAARGWQPLMGFDAGLAATYAAFVEAGAGKKKKKRALAAV